MKELGYYTVYAFIDSQNLNLGINMDIHKNGNIVYSGWKISFKKFRKYLSDTFRVTRPFLFLGYIPTHEKLYENLRKEGYDIIFKPTVRNPFGKVKGNVDAELVLHAAAVNFLHYDKAIIVSGDGDFYCLHEYLKKHDKLRAILIPNQKKESSLLKHFQQYKYFLEREKSKLEQ